MASEPKLRCPCCGGLARAKDYLAAGDHAVEVRRVLRGLGRGRGFEWSTEVAPVEALVMLQEALQRALAQVTMQLEALVAIRAGPCPNCGTVVTPNPAWNQWECSGCGARFPMAGGG